MEKRAEKRNICIQTRCGDSNRSLARLGAELGTVSGNAEPTTDARAVAVDDMRNTVTFAAMNHYMVPLSCPALICNADATAFTVGYTGTKLVKCVYVKTEKDLAPLKVLPQKGNTNLVQFTFKYYLLISLHPEFEAFLP